MRCAPLPSAAAWRHLDVREGFESVFFDSSGAGVDFAGSTSLVEAGRPWVVRYDIAVDRAWHVRSAHVVGRADSGSVEVRLETDGVGHWMVDGRAAPQFDGCLDVDLESSVCTNTVPVHRAALEVGASADAPALYVRLDLTLERLEQRYQRVEGPSTELHFDYESPRFEYHDVLRYDASGLVIEYPGIATRVA